MFKTSLHALLLIVSLSMLACTPLSQSTPLSPFSKKPNEVYNFRHDLVIVKGPVWIFETNGEPVVHGGPVGIAEHSNTYVIEVTPKIFDLPDGGSVSQTNPSEVVELRNAADNFCQETGYTRSGSGMAIHSTNNSTLLVAHCMPPGVEVPRDAKAGDDVQRNPLYRALGIPPLRGRDFYRRYPPEK